MFMKSNFLKETTKLLHSFRICSVGPACKLPSSPEPPNYVSLLSNGVRVATAETCSPIATIGLFIEAGPRFETASNNGITHFIEHMAYKGFRTIDKINLESLAYYEGIKFWAETNREIQTFTAQCYPDYAATVIDILGKIITDLELSDCEMEGEKYNLCLELLDTDNNPKEVLFDYLHATAYQGTSLGQRVIGPTKNLRKFNREQISKFLLDHYQPWRIVIAASGGVSHNEILKYASNSFGGITANPCFQPDYGLRRFTGSEVLYRDDSMTFAHIAIAVEGPGYESPDYLPMMLATEMLGRWDKTQGGCLWNGVANTQIGLAEAASTSHLCENFESFYITYRDTGLWGIYFIAKRMSLDDMLANIQHTWMKMISLCTTTDLQRAKDAAIFKVSRNMAGTNRSCLDTGRQVMYTARKQTVEELKHRINILKLDAVRTAMDRYIYDKCPAVAGVGPTENLPEYNRIRAGMYWLRY